MTEQQELQVYKYCLEQGIELQYGKMTLCDLRNYRYSQVNLNRRWQLHCEDRNHQFSGIYDELEPAIRKFIDLKKKIKKVIR